MSSCASIVAVLLGLSLLACSHDTGRLGTIKVSGIEATDGGSVQVERAGKTLPVAATMGLEPGDSVRTGPNTTLVMRFGEARAVLMPNTKVTLGSIVAWFGRVFISGWLQGKTELVSAAVKGTQYVVEVDEGSAVTTITVLEGTVHVSSVAQRFPPCELTSAQRVRVSSDTAQTPAIETVSRDEFNLMIDAANGARDRALDQLLLPDVIGVRASEAEAHLVQFGFSVSRSEVVVPRLEQVGVVVEQVPSAGSATPRAELKVGRLFKAALDEIKIKAPVKVNAGAQLAFSWTGFTDERDKIVLVPADAPPTSYFEGLTVPAHAGQGELRAPAESGRYELRYLSVERGTVTSRAPFDVNQVRATLRVPNTAEAGSMIRIEWQGPNRKNDLVYLVPAGTPDGTRLEGSDVTLPAEDGSGKFRTPAFPGEYEVRYQLAGVSKRPVIVARAALKVTAIAARLIAPTSCEAGALFDLSWSGPSSADDRILLVPTEQPDYQYYEGLSLEAKPGRGRMRAPAVAGEYELRYALWGVGATIGQQQSGQYARFTVVARARISVVPVTAVLTAVPIAEAGSTVQLSWSGPNRSDDRLFIAPVDSPDDTHWEHAWIYADKGSGELRVPASPGTYELRYILGGEAPQRRVAIARSKIVVTPASARITAPSSIRAGSEITLSWSGPRRNDDQVFLVPIGTPDGQFHRDLVLDAATGRGTLKSPDKAGDYEVRYMLGGVTTDGPAIIARTKVRLVR